MTDKPAAAPLVVVGSGSNSDNSNFQIGIVLNEDNYDLWAPLVEMHIAGRKKMGYLRGTLTAPSEDDPKYDDWFSEDQRVKSWLLSVMKPELMKRHIRLPTAAAIWQAVKTSFVDDKNEVRVYTLNQRAARIRQNGRQISVYFGELFEIFQELDHHSRVVMSCAKDIKIYQDFKERQRVYIFLGGLDDEFEQVRGEILRKEPPLDLQASYTYVRREFDRKEAMKGEGENIGAMLARNNPSRNRPIGDRFSRNKCAHCGRPGHSKQKCYELIGYPEGWDKTRDSRYNKQRASIAVTKASTDSHEEPDIVLDQATALATATHHEDPENDWLWH
ncbi:uncharacterized protein LOC120006034 [Tripterygium wilfordii]|uniref:uncharacterized protein LOC119979808 n=1 Tax=Tripterygium wilfordii TaxID=458696 RepID=UPI0018F7F2DB|nr:uncharacterized protein LOC119979808 [Tripterygium wilfordii]XP_038711840.1 uncharacterized protein LOC120006034 [Tripterygium wilfordii]